MKWLNITFISWWFWRHICIQTTYNRCIHKIEPNSINPRKMRSLTRVILPRYNLTGVDCTYAAFTGNCTRKTIVGREKMGNATARLIPLSCYQVKHSAFSLKLYCPTLGTVAAQLALVLNEPRDLETEVRLYSAQWSTLGKLKIEPMHAFPSWGSPSWKHYSYTTENYKCTHALKSASSQCKRAVSLHSLPLWSDIGDG